METEIANNFVRCFSGNEKKKMFRDDKHMTQLYESIRVARNHADRYLTSDRYVSQLICHRSELFWNTMHINETLIIVNVNSESFWNFGILD